MDIIKGLFHFHVRRVIAYFIMKKFFNLKLKKKNIGNKNKNSAPFIANILLGTPFQLNIVQSGKGIEIESTSMLHIT